MKQFDLNIVEEMEREVMMRDIMIEEFLEDLEEKNQVLEEKQQAIEERNLVIQKLIQEKKASILKMLKVNLAVEVIAEFLVSPVEEIQQYIEEMKQKDNEDKN